MKVVEQTDPEFDEVWAALLRDHDNPAAHISQSQLDYRRHYMAEQMDGRFCAVVTEGGRSVCGSSFEILKGQNGERLLDAVETPSALIVAHGAKPSLYKGAEALMRERIERLARETQANRLVFRDQLVHGGLSALSLWALGKGASHAVQLMQVIDLTRGDAWLWSDLTKSCRWGVNWGRKNMTVKVDREPQSVEELRRLHLAAAGFATRSAETWAIQERQVRDGEAFVVTAALNGAVVSAALFICSKSDCLYGVSASDRSLFEKPIGHVVLWEAVQHARERGCLRFTTGLQVWRHTLPRLAAVTPKEANIAKFKRSFGGKTVPEMVIDLAMPLLSPRRC
jgi:hypothetical protein